MIDWPARLLDALKLAPRLLAAVTVSAAFLAFAPETVLAQLGLAQLVREYRAWFGVALVVSGALLLSHAGHAGLTAVRTRWTQHSNQERLIRRLANLTPHEKKILAGYVSKETRSCALSAANGVVAGLEHEHIIYRATSIPLGGAGGMIFYFNIQPWAWDHLTKNPTLLDGPATEDGASQETAPPKR